MISFLSENEESDIKYLSCFCVYDVQNADLCFHKDLYLEKVHHLAVKQDGTQAEQEQPARLLRHSRRQKLFNIIKCRTNRRSILSMISHQKLAFVHLEKGTFIDLA